MSAKRDKFPKGRRSKPVTKSDLLTKNKDTGKKSTRVTRKQKDVKVSGGKRKVDKSPRKVPKSAARRRTAKTKA